MKNRPTPRTAPAPAPRVRHRSPNDSPLIVSKLGGFTEPDTVARVVWSQHWHGAHLCARPGLTERQYLLCARWAVDVLLGAVEADGSGYAPRPWDQEYGRLTYAELLALEAPMVGAAVDLDQLADDTLFCTDCDRAFRPDSSPSLTLCWECDERADVEDGDQ